jgi:hypothetical protein
MDNVFIERLWRSLKYECVYLHAFCRTLMRGNRLSQFSDLSSLASGET